MKRKIVAALVCGLVLSSQAFAGDEGYVAPEYSAIKSYNFDLKIETNGGKVELEWNKFDSTEKLKWWKLVVSKDNSNPSYPEDHSRYLGDESDKTSASQWLDGGDHYVRLCAITHEMGRYCSAVKKVSIDTASKKDYKKEYYEKKEDHKKDYKKTDYKKVEYKKTDYKATNDYKKKEYKKDYASKAKNYSLSDEMKQRVKEVIEKFVDRLESKGYDDAKMAETLDKVIDRLEGLKSQAKYKNLAGYMIELLEIERNKYDDSFGDLEDILNDF